MLTLGLPAHPVMALLVGAFIIQGIAPGPNVINDEPELFWGLIASFCRPAVVEMQRRLTGLTAVL